MAKIKEYDDYKIFTKPSEVHKSINMLRGIVAGITTDQYSNDDELNELINWCLNHQHLSDRHPFNELIPLIEKALDDNFISSDEAQDIIWLCNNFVSVDDYYDLKTSALQFLHGLIHGILADGEISDDEIHGLKRWLSANDYLRGCYPFDEIESILLSILFDGKITDEEREFLTAFLSNFIDYTVSYNLNENDMELLRNKYSVSGICAICQELNFENNHFCFTGQSSRAKRTEIASLIESLGGVYNNNITKKTKYLIVGNDGNPCWAFSCYGRKIEDAVSRRKDGQNILIVNEIDFWDIVDDLI